MPYIPSSLMVKCFGVKNTRFGVPFEVTVVKHKNNDTYKQTQCYIPVEPYERQKKRCPCCHKVCQGYDTKRESPSSWRTSDFGTVPVFLTYTPSRVKCPEHGVKTEYVPWADGTSRFTESFNNEVTFLALASNRTVVSTYMDINWRTVGNCISACHARLEPDVSLRLKGIRRICVDETSYKRGHKYITVVVDMDTNQVIWLHERHGLEVFKVFCEALDSETRENLELIAGDGASWIDECKEIYFPNAVRCVDPFHVVTWINAALDDVRKQCGAQAVKEYKRERDLAYKEAEQLKAEWTVEYQQYKAAVDELDSLEHRRGRRSKRIHELMEFRDSFEEKYGETMDIMFKAKKEGFLTEEQEKRLKDLELRHNSVKGCKYALGMNPENLNDYNAEKLELIKQSDPSLYRAYMLKEQLRVIIHMTDRAVASEELSKWIQGAKDSEFESFKKLANKVERFTVPILNSIQYDASSSQSEQTNGVVKSLIKMAYGFANLENLFALIYLRCSKLVIPLDNRYVPTAEKLEEIRAKNRSAVKNEKKRRSRKGG